MGRGNWTFFGSYGGGKTAAVLRTFIASCKRSGVEPFAWFRDVLSRIPLQPITQAEGISPSQVATGNLPSPALNNQTATTFGTVPIGGSRDAYV